jgi:hypothetical protein
MLCTTAFVLILSHYQPTACGALQRGNATKCVATINAFDRQSASDLQLATLRNSRTGQLIMAKGFASQQAKQQISMTVPFTPKQCKVDSK